jgi:predicted TIM-barrel fold metal-dependent hydrolase
MPALTIDACVTIGNERETILAAPDLLRQMGRAGVDRAVIQPQDREIIVDNQAGNDRMLRLAKAHPGQLIAACTANPWYGDRAVETVRRAIGEGARMLVFAPSLQGFILGDEVLFPLLDSVAQARVPVYVHTGPHLHAAPWQLMSVAERYPSLPFIMGHSGATDFWNDVPSAASAAPNIYLESSFARPFTFKGHLDKAGGHRGIAGSGAPRNDLEFEWAQLRMVFPPPGHADLYGGTIAGLLDGVRP